MPLLERINHILDMEHLSWGLEILGHGTILLVLSFHPSEYPIPISATFCCRPLCQETGNLSTANYDKTDSIQGFPYILCCKVGVGETVCKMRE